MAIRNQNYYDLQESRPWPLDDAASGISDAGERLPSGLLADLRLRWPKVAGQRAWLGAVTVTPTLATVTILAADDINSASGFVPLAAISLPAPFVPRRPYPLNPLYPGAGGWIVFGVEARDHFWSGKFATPAQSLVQPSTAWAYDDFPVSSVGMLGDGQPLTGLVRLRSGKDVEIVKDCLNVPGYPASPPERCHPSHLYMRDVIVFRLKGADKSRDPVIDAADSTFARYAGPCGGRAESLSCGEPRPIESINGVEPDCCGDVVIEFTGCSIVSEIREEALVDELGDVVLVDEACGFVLDCGLGLADACQTQDRLPDLDGRLPGDVDDLCESASEVSVTVPMDEIEDPGDPDLDEDEASAAGDPGLPILNLFPSSGAAAAFEVRDGEMIFEKAGYYGSLGLSAGASRHVAIHSAESLAHYRRVEVDFTMYSSSPAIRKGLQSGVSLQQNGGAILDYRPVPSDPSRRQFWVAELDWRGWHLGYQSFRIAFFDGRKYVTHLAMPVSGQVQLDVPYRMTFLGWPNYNLPNRSWLEAILEPVGGGDELGLGPVSVANFGEAPARFGLHANQASTAFHRFLLTNL